MHASTLLSIIIFSIIIVLISCGAIKLIRLFKNPSLRKDSPVTDEDIEYDQKLEKAKLKSLISYKDELKHRKAQNKKSEKYKAF